MLKLLSLFRRIFLSKNKRKRFLFACRSCLQFDTLYPLGQFEYIKTETLVNNYIENMQMAKYFTEAKGGVYLNYLQPINGEGRKQISSFEVNSIAHLNRRQTTAGINEFELLRNFYSDLWNKIKDKEYTFDLRSAFHNLDNEIYFDQAHFSDIGYKIIAEVMANEIKSREKNTNKSNSMSLNEAQT